MKYLAIVTLILLTLFSGCAAPLPVYPPMSDFDAIRTIFQRQETLRRVSAECTVLLVDGDGARASLDGVLVAEWPACLRIRAWKLGQAVFDLTLSEHEAWLYQPRHDGAGTGFDDKKLPTQQLRDAWGLLGAVYFKNAVPIEGRGTDLFTRGDMSGIQGIACVIDRTTLTPFRFTQPANGDRPAQQLLLSHYVAIGSHIWPGRMELIDPNGSLIIRFGKVEINDIIPSAAFRPPRRAKLIP